jgi:heme-degrading monooxygenase HmoA
MSEPSSFRPTLALAHAFASIDGPFGGHRHVQPPTPVVRTWRGATRAEDSEPYARYLLETGLTAYRNTPGNIGVLGLRRLRDGVAEFLLVTLWESEAAVRRFSGPEMEKAVFYPEDDRYLVKRDLTVDHFEVFHRSGMVQQPR